MRINTLAVLIITAVLSVVAVSRDTAPAFAAPAPRFDETLGRAYVKLTDKPKVTRSSKGLTIEVKGKGIDLPRGTKVRILFTFRSQVIHTEQVSLSGESFTVKANLKEAPVSKEMVILRSEVHLGDQSKSVQRAIEKDDKTFPLAAQPWTTHHWDDKFPLATDAELEAELQWCREFFSTRYTQLATIDRKVKNAGEAVDKGEAYVEDGALDEEKWRKMMDEEVIAPIVKIQEEIEEGFKGARLLPYRLELSYLNEISRGVAYRVTQESSAIYRGHGLSPAKEDSKPEKLATKTRQRPPIHNKYLGGLIKKIDQSLGITKKKQDKPATEDPKDKKSDSSKDS